jgi:hypothetical protein
MGGTPRDCNPAWGVGGPPPPPPPFPPTLTPTSPPTPPHPTPPSPLPLPCWCSMLFIDFDEFVNNEVEVLERVFKFLGVNPARFTFKPQPPGMQVWGCGVCVGGEVLTLSVWEQGSAGVKRSQCCRY